MRPDYPLTLLYDAACPVCALEMDHLAARNRDGRLVFVDIGAPGFDPTHYGATRDAMNARLHGVRPDGSMLQGMPVLRLAYAAVGLGWVMRPTGWAPLRPLFDAAYARFAKHRQVLSRLGAPLIHAVAAARTARRMRGCTGGACRVDGRSAP